MKASMPTGMVPSMDNVAIAEGTMGQGKAMMKQRQWPIGSSQNFIRIS